MPADIGVGFSALSRPALVLKNWPALRVHPSQADHFATPTLHHSNIERGKDDEGCLGPAARSPAALRLRFEAHL
jgi:hypothetical protein